MTREELQKHIAETCSIEPEHLWKRYPSYCVYRHPGTKRWFLLLCRVKPKSVGLKGDQELEIAVLHCGKAMVGELLSSPGFRPAYHMSKDSWITAILGDGADPEQLSWLLGISYDLAAGGE